MALLVHSHLLPPHEVCDSLGQAALYHTLYRKLEQRGPSGEPLDKLGRRAFVTKSSKSFVNFLLVNSYGLLLRGGIVRSVPCICDQFLFYCPSYQSYNLYSRANGVRSPARVKDFFYSFCVQTGSGAHPASCKIGTGGPFPGGKARPGSDADHSPHLVLRS
jgi:hypothetical protein